MSIMSIMSGYKLALIKSVRATKVSESSPPPFKSVDMPVMIDEDVTRLNKVLDMGDLDLRFHDGRSIKVHSCKLKIACIGGVLQNLIEDVLDDQITDSKRKRTDSDTLPILKVCLLHEEAPMHMRSGNCRHDLDVDRYRVYTLGAVFQVLYSSI